MLWVAIQEDWLQGLLHIHVFAHVFRCSDRGHMKALGRVNNIFQYLTCGDANNLSPSTILLFTVICIWCKPGYSPVGSGIGDTRMLRNLT